jgi:hypothetical protein
VHFPALFMGFGPGKSLTSYEKPTSQASIWPIRFEENPQIGEMPLGARRRRVFSIFQEFFWKIDAKVQFLELAYLFAPVELEDELWFGIQPQNLICPWCILVSSNEFFWKSYLSTDVSWKIVRFARFRPFWSFFRATPTPLSFFSGPSGQDNEVKGPNGSYETQKRCLHPHRGGRPATGIPSLRGAEASRGWAGTIVLRSAQVLYLGPHAPPPPQVTPPFKALFEPISNIPPPSGGVLLAAFPQGPGRGRLRRRRQALRAAGVLYLRLRAWLTLQLTPHLKALFKEISNTSTSHSGILCSW